MNDFRSFAAAIAAHFKTMSKGELYRVDYEGDAIWQYYLDAFPEGTNPIFRVRREHDGSYDRSFVRKLGNVVSIAPDTSLVTIWDAPGLKYPYNVVADSLSFRVKMCPIISLFRIKEEKLGYVSTIQRFPGDGSTREWHHFHATIDAKHITKDVDTVVGEANTTAQVMRRGFEEITPEAVADVLELIQAGTLYRGQEFENNLRMFQKTQREYLDHEEFRDILVWQNLRSPISRLRNTVIGTLLTDLSSGEALEHAVKSYELKVAPTNYKRPTALITKSMIQDATKTIAELGLEPALERRFATLSDISVNNVLWVDNQVKPQMKDGITDLLMKEVKPTPIKDLKPIEVDIHGFMKTIVPEALGIELYFTNAHQNNLVSVTAPVHAEVQPLFKWENSFGWSYNGNITDSIKEKVKAAGGNTNAKLRVSLAWFNHDDLDLHAHCPDGHVYYAIKTGTNTYARTGVNGQILDVDMNAHSLTRTPVENLSWVRPLDGQYRIVVNQFRRRETNNVGFVLEVENNGSVTQFSYPLAVSNNVEAFTFEMKSGTIQNLKIGDKNISGQGISQEKWGIPTEQFNKVATIMFSPNYWDDRVVGNQHWFFIIDGCKTDEPMRGIYNEFLKPELEKHRKVFEVLGNKTKCLPTSNQLSGLGFSSTKRDSVLAKVTDSKSTKIYQINF